MPHATDLLHAGHKKVFYFYFPDLIRGIIDPEKPQTLEDLDVVKEEDVYIYRHEKEMWIKLVFTPTVPHCSLASLIGTYICTCKLLFTFKDFILFNSFVKLTCDLLPSWFYPFNGSFICTYTPFVL